MWLTTVTDKNHLDVSSLYIAGVMHTHLYFRRCGLHAVTCTVHDSYNLVVIIRVKRDSVYYKKMQEIETSVCH